VTLDDLLALLPDNVTGDISPADLRTIVTELYNDANPAYVNVVNQGPFTLPASAAWAPVPGAIFTGGVLSLAEDSDVEFVISTNVDTMVNNNAVQVALNLTGANVVAPGTHPEQVLWAGGKQQVQCRLEVTFLQHLVAGTTSVSASYTAQAASAQLTAMSLIAAVVSNQ
jgi:hypothetical protein